MAPTPKGVAARLVSRRISRSPESRASISRGTELSVVFDSTPLLSQTVTPNSSPSFGFQVQGTNAFTTTRSDGIRMYVDGNIMLDRWRYQAATMDTSRQTLSAGTHFITVEYDEHTGWPTAHLTWPQQ